MIAYIDLVLGISETLVSQVIAQLVGGKKQAVTQGEFARLAGREIKKVKWQGSQTESLNRKQLLLLVAQEADELIASHPGLTTLREDQITLKNRVYATDQPGNVPVTKEVELRTQLEQLHQLVLSRRLELHTGTKAPTVTKEEEQMAAKAVKHMLDRIALRRMGVDPDKP